MVSSPPPPPPPHLARAASSCSLEISFRSGPFNTILSLYRTAASVYSELSRTWHNQKHISSFPEHLDPEYQSISIRGTLCWVMIYDDIGVSWWSPDESQPWFEKTFVLILVSKLPFRAWRREGGHDQWRYWSLPDGVSDIQYNSITYQVDRENFYYIDIAVKLL